jgi:hypothetical protein
MVFEMPILPREETLGGMLKVRLSQASATERHNQPQFRMSPTMFR